MFSLLQCKYEPDWVDQELEHKENLIHSRNGKKSSPIKS